MPISKGDCFWMGGFEEIKNDAVGFGQIRLFET